VLTVCIALQVNGEIVKTQRVTSQVGERQLKGLIQALVDATGSKKGQAVLDSWAEMLPKFWQVVPPSESGTPEVVGDEQAAAVGTTA
jgi:glutamate synthase (ferredoxin)